MLHLPLRDLLPAGHILALNEELGILSQLREGSNHPEITRQDQFTPSELSVLLAVLESYPYYCPYELLLAHFQYRFRPTQVDQKRVEECRRRLVDAEKCGVWDQEMRPARNALSRARLKLRLFGLEVSSILRTGYLLRKRGPSDLSAEVWNEKG